MAMPATLAAEDRPYPRIFGCHDNSDDGLVEHSKGTACARRPTGTPPLPFPYGADHACQLYLVETIPDSAGSRPRVANSTETATMLRPRPTELSRPSL